MLYGFKSPDIPVVTRDGRNVTAISPVDYTSASGDLYRIPEGAQSDGASTPPELWFRIPPFGIYWPAAFLHDAAYRRTLLVYRGSAWQVAALTRDEADSLLKEAMQSLGVNSATVEEIYVGVRIGGWKAWTEDAKVGG